MKILVNIVLATILGGALSFATTKQVSTEKTVSEKEHDHEHEDDPRKEGAGDHDDHDHDAEKEGAHEEEENSSVGPEKGITVVSESDGFKLSVEAVKNFDLRTVRLQKSEPWSVPRSAVLYSGEEVNVYRLRNGFYKRIDFVVLSKDSKEMKIKSPDLKENDEIVVEGVAFLRSAEIVATGGAPEGHSH